MPQTDPALASITAELAELRAAMATQQETIAQQQTTIERQQAAIAALQQSSDAGEAPLSDATDTVGAPTTDEAPAAPRKTSRRTLLVGAAGVAAAATAAAATVVISEPQVAHAATGGNLILGASNDADATTSLTNTTGTAPLIMLEVDANEPGSMAYGIYATAYTAPLGAVIPKSSKKKASLEGAPIGAVIAGFGGADAGSALPAAGKAMPGAGTGGGAGGAAIVGDADVGYGIVARSSSNASLVLGGMGRMLQFQQSFIGAPTGGSFQSGESIRDQNSDLWLCVAGGSPGTWVKVAHLAPGATSGGAITYLSKPIRLLDTRSGATAAHTPGSPYLANTTHTISVAGLSFQGVQVPATCSGAIGNLTVLGLTGQGNWVTLTPAGAGFSGTSNINFVGGQLDSNFYNVGLTGGSLDVIMGVGTNNTGGNANIILDLYAVIS